MTSLFHYCRLADSKLTGHISKKCFVDTISKFLPSDCLHLLDQLMPELLQGQKTVAYPSFLSLFERHAAEPCKTVCTVSAPYIIPVEDQQHEENGHVRNHQSITNTISMPRSFCPFVDLPRCKGVGKQAATKDTPGLMGNTFALIKWTHWS